VTGVKVTPGNESEVEQARDSNTTRNPKPFTVGKAKKP